MHAQELVDHRWLTRLLDSVTGTVFCAWLALTAALLGQTWFHPTGLLLLFVPAIGSVARVWGLAAAMLGLASAASVLCVTLLDPIGHMQVASGETRTDLFWMVLGAAVAAYIFARPQRSYRDPCGINRAIARKQTPDRPPLEMRGIDEPVERHANDCRRLWEKGTNQP